MLRKLGFILLGVALVPAFALAQIVPAQNQQILAPYGGFIVATSSSPTSKLSATTTPFFSNFYATRGNITFGSTSVLSTSVFCLTGDLPCRSTWPTGSITQIDTLFPILGGPITTTGTISFGGLSTSTPWTGSGVGYRTSDNTISTAATGTVSNGIGISVTPGQAVIGSGLTITNTGVTSIVAGTGIAISGATGAVTITSTEGYPFTPGTFGPLTTSATSTPIQVTSANAGFIASSTSWLHNLRSFNATTTNATTTNLSITGLSGSAGQCLTITSGGAVVTQSCQTGAGTNPFTFATNFARIMAATTSPIWGQNGLFGSTTSYFDTVSALTSTTTNASTTNLSARTFAAGGTATTSIDASGNLKIQNLTGLALTTAGTVTAYAGTSCPGQLVQSLSASGVATCAGYSAFPFTPATNYGVNTSATSTPIWGQGGFFGSSTSRFDQIQVGSTTGSTMATSTFFGHLVVSGNASTTNLFLSSAPSCSGSNALNTDAAGKVVCGAVSGTGGASFPFTPTTNFGAAANSTSTAIWFQQGLQASSTSYVSDTNVYGRLDFSTTSIDTYGKTVSTWRGNSLLKLSTTTGSLVNGRSIGFGITALANETGGGQNAAFGYGALTNVTFGTLNTAIGYNAGSTYTTGNNNVLIGAQAGGVSSANGSNNVFLGYQTGSGLGSGSTPTGNTFLGYQVGGGNVAGAISNNIAIGTGVSIPLSATSSLTANRSGTLNIGGILFGAGGTGTSGSDTVPSPRLGVGSTTPGALLALHLQATDSLSDVFVISSSTAAFATSSLFKVTNTGTASTSNLIISSLGGSAGSCLTINAIGLVTTTSCGSGGGGSYPFTPTTNFGVTAQATTGIAWFQNGAQASSTSNFVSYTNASSTGPGELFTTPNSPISFGIRTAGGNLYFATSTGYNPATTSMSTVFAITQSGSACLGIGCTATSSQGTLILRDQEGNGPALFMGGNGGGDTDWTFRRFADNDGSSDDRLAWLATGNAGTSEYLSILSTGNVGVGTSSPYGLLSVNAPATTTPWFVVGSSTAEVFNIKAAATSYPTVGIGTTSPYGTLSLNAPQLGATTPYFVIGSSTEVLKVLASSDPLLGLGTTSPWANVSVQGATAQTRPLAAFFNQAGSAGMFIDVNGRPVFKGSAPSLSSCGTSPTMYPGSNDATGFINMGAGSVTACTVTFANAWANPPVCLLNEATTTSSTIGLHASTTVSTLSVGLSGSLGGKRVGYHCFGTQP